MARQRLHQLAQVHGKGTARKGPAACPHEHKGMVIVLLHNGLAKPVQPGSQQPGGAVKRVQRRHVHTVGAHRLVLCSNECEIKGDWVRISVMVGAGGECVCERRRMFECLNPAHLAQHHGPRAARFATHQHVALVSAHALARRGRSSALGPCFQQAQLRSARGNTHAQRHQQQVWRSRRAISARSGFPACAFSPPLSHRAHHATAWRWLG